MSCWIFSHSSSAKSSECFIGNSSWNLSGNPSRNFFPGIPLEVPPGSFTGNSSRRSSGNSSSSTTKFPLGVPLRVSAIVPPTIYLGVASGLLQEFHNSSSNTSGNSSEMCLVNSLPDVPVGILLDVPLGISEVLL